MGTRATTWRQRKALIVGNISDGPENSRWCLTSIFRFCRPTALSWPRFPSPSLGSSSDAKEDSGGGASPLRTRGASADAVASLLASARKLGHPPGEAWTLDLWEWLEVELSSAAEAGQARIGPPAWGASGEALANEGRAVAGSGVERTAVNGSEAAVSSGRGSTILGIAAMIGADEMARLPKSEQTLTPAGVADLMWGSVRFGLRPPLPVLRQARLERDLRHRSLSIGIGYERGWNCLLVI